MVFDKVSTTFKGFSGVQHLNTSWRRLQDTLLAIFAILAWDTVADLEALAAITGVGNGSARYVRTLRASFVLDTASVAAADGINVVGALGGGNWIRQAQANPTWALQPTWYVNPTTGNDENSGLTTAEAIATLSEWARRVENLTIKQTTTIWIEQDLVASDILALNVTLSSQAELRFEGVMQLELEAPISAWVPQNEAANIPGQIALAGWTAATHVGRSLTFTDGPAQGHWSWVVRDVGAGLANISSPIDGFLPVAYPAVGNTARIYTLPRIRVSSVQVESNWPSSFSPPVQFTNIGVLSGAIDCWMGATGIGFTNCWFDGGLCDNDKGYAWYLTSCSGGLGWVAGTVYAIGGVYAGISVSNSGKMSMQAETMFDSDFPADALLVYGLFLQGGKAYTQETVWLFGTFTNAIMVLDGGNASLRGLCGNIVGSGVVLESNASMGLDSPTSGTSSSLVTTTGDIIFRFAGGGSLTLTFAQVPYTSYHTGSKVYAHDIHSQQNLSGSVPCDVSVGKKGALTPGSVAPGVFVLADLTESATELPKIAIQNAILGNLRAHLGTEPGAGESVTVVVYVNGIATTLTCTISGLDTSAVNWEPAYRVMVSPGDRISVRIITTNNGGPFEAANLSVNMEMA